VTEPSRVPPELTRVPVVRLLRRRFLAGLGLAAALAGAPLAAGCGQPPVLTPRPEPRQPATAGPPPARPTPTITPRPTTPTPAPTTAPAPTRPTAMAPAAPTPTIGAKPTLGPAQVSGEVPPLARIAQGVRYGSVPDLKYRGDVTFWAQAYTPLNATPARPRPPRYLNRLIAEYRQLHPGIEIRLVPPAEATASPGWLNGQVAAKTAPDIFWGHHSVLNLDLPRGAAVDLRPWLDKPNPYVTAGQTGSQRWRDLFLPWVLETIAAPGGAIYEVNADAVATALFYNKEAFARVGRREAPATFREFLELLSALKTAGYRPALLGVGSADYRWSWWAREAATVLFGRRFDELRVEGPRYSLSVLSQLVGYRRGILHPREPAYAEIWRIYQDWSRFWGDDVAANVDFYREFAQGKAAIMWNGTWVVPQLLGDPAVRFEWGSFAIPVITRETSPLSPELKGPPLGAAGGPAAGFQYWVSSDKANRTMTSEKLEACVDWLRFLTLPWCVEPLCNDLGFFVPTIRGTRPLTELVDAVAGLERQVPVISPFHEPDPEASAGYQRLVQGYVAGQASLDEFRQQLTQHLDATADRLVRANGWDLSRYGVK